MEEIPESLRRDVAAFVDDVAATRGRPLAQNWANRFEANPESSLSEVVIWRVLRDAQLGPIYELPCGTLGPPDFTCSSHLVPRFAVEVTNLSAASVQTHTQFPADEFGPFQFDLHSVREALSKKYRKLHGIAFPAIVAVCTFHPGGAILLNRIAAAECMLGKTFTYANWAADGADLRPRGEGRGTKLDKALFVRSTPSRAEPRRRDISAVVLAALSHDEARLLALLHPHPIHPLPSALFGSIPVAQITPWPATSKIGMHWSLDDPETGIWRRA